MEASAQNPQTVFFAFREHGSRCLHVRRATQKIAQSSVPSALIAFRIRTAWDRQVFFAAQREPV